MRERFSLTVADEGRSVLNPREIKVVKGLFDGCDGRFFDLEADLGYVILVEVFAGFDVDLETVSPVLER